jgi:hypothetical protein
LRFRAAVKTDAGTAAAAHTDESKVRFAVIRPQTSPLRHFSDIEPTSATVPEAQPFPGDL